jgi:hypothetical protein
MYEILYLEQEEMWGMSVAWLRTKKIDALCKIIPETLSRKTFHKKGLVEWLKV